jgi:hypothetical protein
MHGYTDSSRAVVERPVQPLRTNSTEMIPIMNGTMVTTRIAYQNPAPSRFTSVTAIATSEANEVVRQRTAIDSMCVRASAWAKMMSA